MGDHPGEDVAAQLRRVAAYEQRLRRTPLTGLLRVLAPTRPFAAFYRRVGPRLDRFLIRASSGRVASRLYGLPVLLLSSTGAKSGQTRTTPLLYVRDGVDFAVAGTNFGHPAHPGWTANLLATPAAAIEIGPERIRVTANSPTPLHRAAYGHGSCPSIPAMGTTPTGATSRRACSSCTHTNRRARTPAILPEPDPRLAWVDTPGQDGG